MKNCTDCKHADWLRTAAGSLHRSGHGECRYPWKLPALPASMWWIGQPPKPNGGLINRRRDLKDHCAYYARKES